jgi:hypothetical protein
MCLPIEPIRLTSNLLRIQAKILKKIRQNNICVPARLKLKQCKKLESFFGKRLTQFGK